MGVNSKQIMQEVLTVASRNQNTWKSPFPFYNGRDRQSELLASLSQRDINAALQTSGWTPVLVNVKANNCPVTSYLKARNTVSLRTIWVPKQVNPSRFEGVYPLKAARPATVVPTRQVAPAAAPVKRGPGRPPKALTAAQRDQRVSEILMLVRDHGLGLTIASRRLHDLFTGVN